MHRANAVKISHRALPRQIRIAVGMQFLPIEITGIPHPRLCAFGRMGIGFAMVPVNACFGSGLIAFGSRRHLGHSKSPFIASVLKRVSPGKKLSSRRNYRKSASFRMIGLFHLEV